MKQQNHEILSFLRMKMLAGLISESKYQRLLEDINVVDRILDKINDQGIKSLTPEEKEYLDRYSKGETNIPRPISGNTTVYVGLKQNGTPTELYKIENLPAIPNAENVWFKCTDTKDKSTCEGYAEMIEMLKNNPKFKLVLDKISGGFPLYFHSINFDGNFSSPNDIAYAQFAGDGQLYIVDSMEQFDNNEYGNYQDLEKWGITDWKKL